MPHHRSNTGMMITLAVLLAAFSLPEMSATAIFRWPWPLALPLVLMTLAAWTIYQVACKRTLVMPSWKWLGGIGLVIVGGLVSLVASGMPYNGLPMLVAMVSLAYLFVGSCQMLSREPSTSKLVQALGWVGLSVSLVSLYRWGIGDVATGLGLLDPLNSQAGEVVVPFRLSDYRNAQPFGHQNYTAGAMLLMIPMHVWLAAANGGRQRVLWGFAVVLDMVCLVSTYSRGAWLGLAGASALFLFWLWRSQRLSPLIVRRIAIVGTALTLLLFALNPRLALSATSLVTRGTTGIDQVRAGMAEAGIEMAKDNWLLGVGPGNMTKSYPPHRARLDAALEDFYQLHITPLQIWVEQGLVGIAGWCLIVLGGVEAFRRRTIGPSNATVAAAFGLVGYGLFALTDYQLDVPMIAGVICLYLAVVARETSRTHHLQPRALRGLIVTLALIATIALGLLLPELKSRHHFAQAMQNLRAGQADDFLLGAEKAAQTSRSPDYFLNQLASYHMEAWAFATNDIVRSTEKDRAVGMLKQSLRANPHQEFCHFNLGWLLRETEPSQAATHFVHAARLVPDRKGVYQGLGLCLRALGEFDAAQRAFALECITSPAFITSAFLTQGEGAEWQPAIRHHVDALLEAAKQHLPEGDVRQIILDRRLKATRWFWSGDTNNLGEIKWHPSIGHLWRTVMVGKGEYAVPVEPSAPWKYLHAAWAESEDRRNNVVKALIAATKSQPNQSTVDRLVSWVDQEAWSDVIRKEPPKTLFRAYRRQRSGFNLLARNMDGIKPVDLCDYIDNHVLELFFSNLLGSKSDVPSPVVLKWLDDIISEVPEVHNP